MTVRKLKNILKQVCTTFPSGPFIQDSFSVSRSFGSCGLIRSPDNGLEVVLGSYGTSEIFNVGTAIWREGPEMPHRYWSSTAQQSNSFVVVGGLNETSGFVDTLIAFDEINYEWVVLPQRLEAPKDVVGVVALPRNVGIIC